MRTFVGCFHFAPARHLLLAALHSKDVSEAERIERIFRFETQPVHNSSRRAPRGKIPELPDLTAMVARICLCQVERTRHLLEAICRQMERAWQNYPAVHSAHLRRIQRAALVSEVRSRYAAEIAGAVTDPLTCLRGFQHALFYLKQCGMADAAAPVVYSHSDPWDDCIDDVDRLRARLARRFADPEFRSLLHLPRLFLGN
jgi:hypothetical protein